MTYQLSVIICTHNPRPVALQRTLESLQKQTLNKEYWELVLVDNHSTEPLHERFNLSWHPAARHVREDVLGLTPARLRGIKESASDLILFVDDDNVLKENYLELAWNTMHAPIIGVLGAGKILPEFEQQPSAEVLPHTGMLALREEDRAWYSNEVGWHKAIPYGAGMLIRKQFALEYMESCTARSFAAGLDRSGNALLSGGDVDLALFACKNGFVAAVLPELEMLHLIPAGRLTEDYMVRIAAGHAYSHYILSKLWGYNKNTAGNPLLSILRYWKKRFAEKGLRRRIYMAEYKAIADAMIDWDRASSIKKK